MIGPLIPPPTTGREKRKHKPRSNFKVSRVVEHHDRRRLAGKATGGQASQCASGSGRRPKKDLFLNAPNFPQGAAGTRWTPMRRQRQTAATTRPPRTWRATMARCRPFSRRVLSPLLSGQPGTRERKWRPCGAQCGGVTRNSVRVSNRFTGFRIENASVENPPYY